jgi:hypothetical protein
MLSDSGEEVEYEDAKRNQGEIRRVTLPFDTRDVWGKARTASLLVMGKRTMKEWVVIHYKDWACFHSGIERVGRL